LHLVSEARDFRLGLGLRGIVCAVAAAAGDVGGVVVGVDWAGFGFKLMSCRKHRLGCKNIFGLRNHEMGSFWEPGNFFKF
jgi:hypothetical protein